MNYFLKITSRPNLPFVFSMNNIINGSYLGVGKFINQQLEKPLNYEDSNNSDVVYDDLIKNDVLDTVGGGFLISKRLKELIESNFQNEVQFFATIANYKGKEIDDYFAFNVYNKIECYDLKKSIYSVHSVDQSYYFKKAVLKNSPLEEYGMTYNIVRCVFDDKIVVSEKFKVVMELAKIKNFKFIK